MLQAKDSTEGQNHQSHTDMQQSNACVWRLLPVAQEKNNRVEKGECSLLIAQYTNPGC